MKSPFHRPSLSDEDVVGEVLLITRPDCRPAPAITRHTPDGTPGAYATAEVFPWLIPMLNREAPIDGGMAWWVESTLELNGSDPDARYSIGTVLPIEA